MAYALSTNKQWQCPLTYIRHRRISFRQGQSPAVFFIPDYKNGHDFFLAVPLLFPSFLLNYCKNVTEKQRLNVKKCIFFFTFLPLQGIISVGFAEAEQNTMQAEHAGNDVPVCLLPAEK